MFSDEERSRLTRLQDELTEQDPGFVNRFELREHVIGQRALTTGEVGDRVLLCLALWWVALIASLLLQEAYGSFTAAIVCLVCWSVVSGVLLPRHPRRTPT